MVCRLTTVIFLGAFLAGSAMASDIPLHERRSGTEFMGPELQAMQKEEMSNPGTLWVLDGAEIWKRREGASAKSCADCHQDATQTMKGVAARYPAFDDTRNRPISLEGRVNACRERHMGAKPLAYESKELLALTAFVARQSQGLPISMANDPRLMPFAAAGKEAFELRQGQLNLACATCHTEQWGEKLGGIPIPQAHPTGYPVYRLEWQGLGSLQRRLRNCLNGMRAANHAFGSQELVNLELYLMSRAGGMTLESPAVRP